MKAGIAVADLWRQKGWLVIRFSIPPFCRWEMMAEWAHEGGNRPGLRPESRILDNLAQFIGRFGSKRGWERLKKLSSLTFVTGPSRTADIEQTLTIGVHGPQSLQVLLLKAH